MRIGLTGTPGVGKSSFIEALGTRLTAAGWRVAVLAVDPSSSVTGGAILGDKTRMPLLARDPNAFVRPTPSGLGLGGVAAATRQAIQVVEGAGFDVVLVETVGVGQSETRVAELTDIFVLLIAPGGGDELQGVKRGIMERADFVVVNKADGELVAAAEATRADYEGALRLFRRRPHDPDGVPAALAVSAATGVGLDALWERIVALDAHRRETGWRALVRAEQAVAAMGRALEDGIARRLAADPQLRAFRSELERAVRDGNTLPEDAADRLLEEFLQSQAVKRDSS